MTEPVGLLPPLTVMTVNIHKGFTFNRKFILPELREAVRKVDADGAFLQEVLGTHEKHDKKLDGAPHDVSVAGLEKRGLLSPALNLEANLVVRHRGFNATRYERLDRLVQHSFSREIEGESLGEQRGWGLVRGFLAYHFTRRYPRWAFWRQMLRPLPALDRSLTCAER